MSDIPPTRPQDPASGLKPNDKTETGMATTSLVSGLLSLIGCFPGAILAIITGIIALARYNREPYRYGGRGAAIGGIVTGGVGLVIVPFVMAVAFSIFLPSLSRARELSKRIVCAANMKGIGTSMLIYASDHPDGGIPTMAALIKDGAFVHGQTLCPASGLQQSNYIFLPLSADQVGNNAGRKVWAYEPKSNHADEGGNILFTNGTVEFIKTPEFDRLIAKATESQDGD